MPGYRPGQQDKEHTQRPMVRHEDRTVEQRQPHHTHRNHLDLQRNGLMLHEVPDIGTELGMIQQPVIKPLVATKEERGRQQEQRSGGNQRQKDSCDTQSKRNKSQYR